MELENLEFENLEFENSEFENLGTENLEFENLETENLDLLADKVKVMIHLWALLVKLNNFTFGNKAVLCPQPQAGIEAGALAELGKNNLRWGLTYFWIKLITAIIFHFGESVKFHLYLTVNYSSGYRSLV